jgi:hypothetical protein
MPIYTYRCPHGHLTELYFPTFTRVVRACDHRAKQGRGACALLISQILTAPLLVKAAPDVCYTSPIDGTPITSMAQRREDLARSGCRPYDPDQKTDYTRRLTESEAALDRTIEASVEEAVEKMPTATRGKLFSELTEQGVTAEVVRRASGA